MPKKASKISKSLIVIGQDMVVEFPKLLTPKVIENPIEPVVNFLQGVATRGISRFLEDYRQQKDAGKVKTEGFFTDKPEASFIDLLKFIGHEVPDEERMKALKSIFFYGTRKDATEQDEILAYEFLQTAKRLSGTEILILKANFEISNGQISETVPRHALPNANDHRSTWRKVIAKQMGYGDMDSVVTKYEHNLESLGLISPRLEMDRLQAQFEATQKLRLTEMDYKFCEFITNYK
jgi:hypothetical protein